ncbi:zinc-binding dehydrogenase [Phyllobacterium sp. SB3]|uniref:quinone oxidoreductase family protein n=1 Tax=Phyllobacterium sp. SB3 TaxID=3156073 RepID=UPI0032AEDCEC
MKSVQLSRFGGPDFLELVDVPTPAPESGEVLIRVRAAGVNFFETLMRQDRYAVTPDLPIVFGVEVAGTVEVVGPGVDIAPYARVAVPLFLTRGSGGYSDYITANADALVPVPDNISFEAAVGLMVQGMTALQAVRRSPPVGKTVLINAAAGGVGTLLIQLAKQEGARQVIAAASTAEKLHLAQSLGADIGVNYSQSEWVKAVRQATGGLGADVIYDFVGGSLTKACLEVLAPSGELLFGALGRVELDRDDLESMFLLNRSLKGLALIPLLTPEIVRSDLAELFGLAANGQIRVVIGGSFPLSQASEAHRKIDERATVGKIVLLP